MELWKELLSTTEGQFSIAVIVVTIGMGFFLWKMFIKNALDKDPEESNKV